MLNPSKAAYRNHSAVAENVHQFPVETFEKFSREELLAVLSLMHRILGADRKRDVERLMTELPKLCTSVSGKNGASHDDRGMGVELAEHPPRTENTSQMLSYLFSCLSKAKTKMSSSNGSRIVLTKSPCHLSPRELTVLCWMKEGKTNGEIAGILGLSERTVRFHVESIFEKLDVTSRTQAVARAMDTGLIAS
jgi:DNA-binding CsgD family transcriptional regulator